MPYKIVKKTGKFCVVKKDTGEVVKCHSSESRAMAHLKALYANVKE